MAQLTVEKMASEGAGYEERGTELLFSETKPLRYLTHHSLVPSECITDFLKIK